MNFIDAVRNVNVRSFAVAGLVAVTFFAFETPASAVNFITNGSFDTTSGGFYNHSGPSQNTNLSGQAVSCDNSNVCTTILTGWNVSTASGGNAIGILYASGDQNAKVSDQFGTNNFQLWQGTNPNTIPNSSPDGGHFLVVDGGTGYNLTLYQSLTGLTVGTTYVLNFYQAAGQQTVASGATTEDWQVTLADSVHGTSVTKTSTVMNTPSQSFTPWNLVSMNFTATNATETISFLSQGTPSGLPPMVFLDGVSFAPTPEPATFGFVALGLGGLVALRRKYKLAK